MSDENKVNEFYEKNDEPKDDVQGHRLIEKEEVMDEADVEGHVFDMAEKAEKAE